MQDKPQSVARRRMQQSRQNRRTQKTKTTRRKGGVVHILTKAEKSAQGRYPCFHRTARFSGFVLFRPFGPCARPHRIFAGDISRLPANGSSIPSSRSLLGFCPWATPMDFHHLRDVVEKSCARFAGHSLLMAVGPTIYGVNVGFSQGYFRCGQASISA